MRKYMQYTKDLEFQFWELWYTEASVFGAYETAKGTILKLAILGNIFAKLAVAQFITDTAGVISYHLDTIRRRMMMHSGRADVLNKNTLDCGVKIAKKEGTKAFFKGALSNFF